MRVAVALSGGVDSLAAMLLLQRAGHDVMALHGLFFGSESVGQGAIEALCRKLGVPLHVADLRAIFREKVITPFVRAHAAGQTPNPCALCNAAIKFGALLDIAISLGCEAMASGHYAALHHGVPRLSANSLKDQSYFLALVPGERLAQAIFPLAGLSSKEETRALVAKAGLRPPAPAESQDVCFLAGQGRLEFLRSEGLCADAGDVWLKGDNGQETLLGRHEGLWLYTTGQRKGLGIPWREPLYVLDKRPHSKALLLGPGRLLGMRRMLTAPANYFVPSALWPEIALVRCRHRGPLMPSRVLANADGSLDIRLEGDAFPSAPGQIAALYDQAGRLLAGACIARIL